MSNALSRVLRRVRRPRWITKTLKRQVIHALNTDGRDTGPYLVRWAINTSLGGVKVHHFLRGDEDRDCHDHPWSFLSIILRGGYWEHRPKPCEGKPHGSSEMPPGTHVPHPLAGDLCQRCGRLWREPDQQIRRWYGPGRVLWRPAPSVHRVELPPGRTAWTLVFTGPKRREWGFHTVCGFIPWLRYAAAKEDGC